MAACDPVQALGRALGLDRLDLDPRGACVLELDQQPVELCWQPAGCGVLALVGRLGTATPGGRSDLLANLLLANLFLIESGYPHAAFDPRDDRVALCLSLPVSLLQPAALAGAVRSFAQACRSLRESLLAQQLLAL